MTSTIRAYKTELRPTRAQAETLASWCEASMRLYNWGLRGREAHYLATGETLTHYAQDKAFTRLKRDEPEFEFLREVPRRVAYFALRDLDSAFKHFFRRVKQGGAKPGFPRLKREGSSFTVYGPDVAIGEDRIRLPRLGWVRLKERGYIPVGAEKYGEVTVSRRADRWFVSVMVEEVIPERKAEGPAVAAHPGVRTFLTIVDAAGHEERIENRRALGFYQKRLRRIQRKLARQEKGSANRAKTREQIAKLHYRIASIRGDATHKATHRVTRGLSPEKIIIQTWRVREMLESDSGLPKWLQRRIKRGIVDANIGEQLRQIRYKADWYGAEVIELEADVPISKTCSRCGVVKDDLGMEQTFRCGSCGLEIDRETNAAYNMLATLFSEEEVT